MFSSGLKVLCKAINLFLILVLVTVSSAVKSNALSVGEERKIGQRLLYQIRLAFPTLDDPDISQYINSLGEEVLNVAGFQYFDYHFTIIASSQFNAFAAPSGLVFFYSGLIEKMDNEDELVSVLAHEIGHVAARHIAEGMEQGTQITVATTLLALVGLALGAGALSQALLTGSLAAGHAANLHFSRKHEEEADRMAYGWMKEMGRHPRGQEEMLREMNRINRYTMGNAIPQYLLTHPYPAERLDYIQSLIAYEGKKLNEFKETDNFAFLRMKYRVMSLVQEGKKFRNFLQSRLASTTLDQRDKVMLYYGFSQLDRNEKNYTSAKEYLQKVMRFYPEKSILLADMGVLEMEAGHKKRALPLLQTAYDRDRNDMWAAFQLARLWFQLEEYGKAEKFLIEVKSELPTFSKVYYELGKVKAATGKKADSAFYLALYNLYEGRLNLAKYNLKIALKGEGMSDRYKEEIKEMKKTIETLEKE